nr:MAG TPA: hypothetical protein [Caudoviricetes sp.]
MLSCWTSLTSFFIFLSNLTAPFRSFLILL